MTKRSLLISIAFCLALVCGGVVFAQQPFVDIGNKHGNLRAAQQDIVRAWEKVNIAQQDNRYRLGGHAGRAKELLEQANQELRLAADVANEHK